MIIDCNTCDMQSTTACDECIVPVLLHQMSGPFALAHDEAVALDNLADAGLVAPLRLVPLVDPSVDDPAVDDPSVDDPSQAAG